MAGAALALAVAAAVVFWQVAHVALVIFAACLVAVLLDGLVRLVQMGGRIPRAVAFTIVLAVLAGGGSALVALLGPQLGAQTAELSQRIPAAIDRLGAMVRATDWGRAALAAAPSFAEIGRSGAALAGRVPGMFTSVVGVATNLVFLVLIGLYAAAEPSLYRHGTLHLVPLAHRERARDLAGQLGHALRWWLLGRFAAMAAVGVLTAVGLALIDLPLALALGAIAGLFSFVPFVGPIVSAVPAVLIALVEGPGLAAIVVLIYAGVQFLEGHFLTPLIQQRTVSLPPALLLAAQLVAGGLFGLVGLLLATPLAVVAVVLVQVLYVQDLVGEDIRVLGEHGG